MALLKDVLKSLRYKESQDEVARLTARNDKLQADNERMRAALIQLRDCNWVVPLPDRMDRVRQIAREGLGEQT